MANRDSSIFIGDIQDINGGFVAEGFVLTLCLLAKLLAN